MVGRGNSLRLAFGFEVAFMAGSAVFHGRTVLRTWEKDTPCLFHRNRQF
ncbi:hypothetical protein P6U16_05930 [Rhizobium sp. 32-5/1]|nr:hypothetical protein [Rhizobium sp. 32-5/1]WEZ84212.1 hypothetical protein P6U16_05930 [Rhizobium sp. 32-5/1]